MLDLEINIVVYKHVQMAKKLVSQFLDSEAKVIRIWDNSPTPSPQHFPAPAIEYRHHRFNPSLSRVWNWAIGQSESRHVIVSNDDIDLRPGWYGRLSREVEACPNALWHGPSRCFLFDKRLIDTVGWFDERMTGITYEDLDYVRRLNHAGIDHRYGVMSCFEGDAQTLKQHTLNDRFNPPANNRDFFIEKYGDADGEDFYGTPLFPTPDFYPNRDIHLKPIPR